MCSSMISKKVSFKRFVSLNGADHLLSNRKDSEYVGNIIATWADRYL